MNNEGKKVPEPLGSKGGNRNYPTVKLGGGLPPLLPEDNNIDKNDGVLPQEEEVKYKREIFNLSEDLVKRIEDYISQEARAGTTAWDEKAKKEKKINRSLWVRKVLNDALEQAGYVPTPEPPPRKRS